MGHLKTATVTIDREHYVIKAVDLKRSPRDQVREALAGPFRSADLALRTSRNISRFGASIIDGRARFTRGR